eukprot:6866568-Alexandrium_andersonii.AAC.1
MARTSLAPNLQLSAALASASQTSCGMKSLGHGGLDLQLDGPLLQSGGNLVPLGRGLRWIGHVAGLPSAMAGVLGGDFS